MANLDIELSNLKKRIDDIKEKKIQAATKLAALEEQKDALLKECVALGVDSYKIAEAIAEKEASLQQALLKIKQELSLLE